MSRKNSLLALRDKVDAAPEPRRFEQAPANPTQAPSRRDRKQIAGFFSPQMSIAMRSAALKRQISLQDAMAEAFNMWLRAQGESPVGD